jgi:hypothetical protein
VRAWAWLRLRGSQPILHDFGDNKIASGEVATTVAR